MQIIILCVVFMGCETAMNSYVHAATKNHQNIYVAATQQTPIYDSRVEEDEEKAQLVENYMRELGYEEQQIEDVSLVLTGRASMMASVFSTSMSVWVFLALAELIAIICMVLFIVKNTRQVE